MIGIYSCQVSEEGAVPRNVKCNFDFYLNIYFFRYLNDILMNCMFFWAGS